MALGRFIATPSATTILRTAFAYGHSTSATGIVGSTASFGVTARGTPPLHYQWQLNFANMLGATNPVLVLSGLTPADAGLYRAVVTNAFGAATSLVATLTVIDFPKIS